MKSDALDTAFDSTKVMSATYKNKNWFPLFFR